MWGGWRGLRRPETHRPAPEANMFGFGVAKYVRDTSSSLKIPLAKMKDSGCQLFGGAITRQIVRDSAAGSCSQSFCRAATGSGSGFAAGEYNPKNCSGSGLMIQAARESPGRSYRANLNLCSRGKQAEELFELSDRGETAATFVPGS